MDNVVLKLDNVYKFFGPVKAVNGVSLEVRRGEVMTLLGPSGCGKSTTLRLIIGLEQAQDGEITYEGRVLDAPRKRVYVPPHKRNMGMVFQSYAIWPHMTVFENVAYPLRVRRVRGPMVREAVLRALDLVGLHGLAERPATHLSGGQQQRVAVARALVFEPSILLLDEPFSNLDAKLREQMRIEVKLLQQRLGITVVFVTHDQIEALALSDRIAVMDQGVIEQLGSPEDLYLKPRTDKVRDFLGRVILLSGQAKERNGQNVTVALQNGTTLQCHRCSDQIQSGSACRASIRPEHIEVIGGAPDGTENVISGTIETLLFLGDRYESQIQLSSGSRILIYLPAEERWKVGQEIFLRFPPDKLQAWPA